MSSVYQLCRFRPKAGGGKARDRRTSSLGVGEWLKSLSAKGVDTVLEGADP